MVELKLPESEFKGLLNFARDKIKHVYENNLLSAALKNQLLFKLLKTQLHILPSYSQYLNINY